MKLILPKRLLADPAKLTRALTNALNGVALDIKVDFEVTQQTWKDKATFTISSPNAYTRVVETDDENYRRLTKGTPPHVIRPRGKVLVFKTPFTSKTLPRQIMSRGGSTGGNVVITRGPINHPGTAPREFDKVIQIKWDKQFGKIMQRAVDSEV